MGSAGVCGYYNYCLRVDQLWHKVNIINKGKSNTTTSFEEHHFDVTRTKKRDYVQFVNSLLIRETKTREGTKEI